MREKFGAAEICVVAEKILLAEFPRLEKQFRPKFVKNKILHIAVKNSSVAAELRLAENFVLENFRARGEVRSIRYSTEKLDDRPLPF
jgi:hypothetical protein